MKNDKRVMILDPAGNMWGSERVLLDFINSKTSNSHKIGLCCPGKSTLESAIDKSRISFYPYFIARLHERGIWWRALAATGLYRACRAFRPDVIYVNQAGATKIALFVAWFVKVPVVPHVRLLEDVVYLERLRPSKKSVPKIIAVSHYISDAFKDDSLIKRLKVIYDAYKSACLTEILPAQNSEISNICCAGRLVPVKGQDMLIKAFSLLIKFGFRVKLNIYGSGLQGQIFEEELKELTISLGIEEYVSFHGYVNDVPGAMRSNSIVVCPSIVEPLGRVIFEAWDSFCLPIAGRSSGGAAEVITKSRGGILYDENSPESLAAALVSALTLNQEHRKNVIANGRLWLKENCSAEEYSAQLLNILDTETHLNVK